MEPEIVRHFEAINTGIRATNVLLVELLGRQFEMKQHEMIECLGRSGMSPREIAQLVDTSMNTVQVTLSRKRKKTRGMS